MAIKTNWSAKLGLGMALAVCAFAGAAPDAAMAQQQGNDFRYMTVIQRPREAYDPRGFRLGGGFQLLPSIDVSETYDDNLYAAAIAPIDDFETTISPRLNITSDWSRHQFDFEAFGNIHRYVDRTTEDNDEYGALANLKLDLAEEASLSIGGGYGRQTVERGNPDEAGRLTPEQVDVATGDIGWSKNFSRLLLGARGGIIHRREVSELDRDRDRDEYKGAVRVGYIFSPALNVFVEPSYQLRDYVTSRGVFAFNQDSTVLGGSFGVAYDITGLLYGETLIGYYDVDFSDSRLQNSSGLSIKSNTTWNVTARDTLILTISRENDVTSQQDASSVERTGARLQYQHELRRNIVLRAGFYYFQEKYVQSLPERTDDVYEGNVRADYYINRNFSFFAEYRRASRESSIPSDTFDDNRFTIGLHSQI